MLDQHMVFENALSVMIANWIAVRCRKGVSLNSQSISSCRGGSSSSAYKPTVFYKHLLAFLRTNFGTVYSVYSCTFCHLPGAVKSFLGNSQNAIISRTSPLTQWLAGVNVFPYLVVTLIFYHLPLPVQSKLRKQAQSAMSPPPQLWKCTEVCSQGWKTLNVIPCVCSPRNQLPLLLWLNLLTCPCSYLANSPLMYCQKKWRGRERQLLLEMVMLGHPLHSSLKPGVNKDITYQIIFK